MISFVPSLRGQFWERGTGECGWRADSCHRVCHGVSRVVLYSRIEIICLVSPSAPPLSISDGGSPGLIVLELAEKVLPKEYSSSSGISDANTSQSVGQRPDPFYIL